MLTDFSAFLNLDITHPALVRRAFLLMCEAKPKGKVRECRALRKRVLDASTRYPTRKAVTRERRMGDHLSAREGGPRALSNQKRCGV